MRWIRTLLGLVLVAFGLGCLNYTNFSGIEHHREWAAEKGAPAPSDNIHKLGMVLTPVGGGLLGYLLGSKRPQKKN